MWSDCACADALFYHLSLRLFKIKVVIVQLCFFYVDFQTLKDWWEI